LSLHLGFRPKFSILKEYGELSRNFKTFFLWESGFEGRVIHNKGREGQAKKMNNPRL
jgi:hypothetical protein